MTARAARWGLAAAAACLVAGGAACGNGGLSSPDLFVVKRSGAVPDAGLELVVNDGGTARCNRGAPVRVPDSQLLKARYLQRQLRDPARQQLRLAPGAQPVLHYVIRTPDGRLSFSDDSPGQPAALFQLSLLVRQLAQQVCHLAR